MVGVMNRGRRRAPQSLSPWERAAGAARRVRVYEYTLSLPALTPALSQRERGRKRRGSATIDYFLIIAIVLPLAAFILRIAPRAIQLVYDLLTVVVAWPFM